MSDKGKQEKERTKVIVTFLNYPLKVKMPVYKNFLSTIAGEPVRAVPGLKSSIKTVEFLPGMSAMTRSKPRLESSILPFLMRISGLMHLKTLTPQHKSPHSSRLMTSLPPALELCKGLFLARQHISSLPLNIAILVL